MKYENKIEDHPKSISLEGIEIMKKNICKINIGNKTGIGYFCKLPLLDENDLLSVLITNNYIIDESILKNEKKIKIILDNEEKEIELENRIKYTNKEYDITIIEIKEINKINNYIEIDNNKISNISYKGESIYMIYYSGNKIRVSYGIIKEENKNEFINICNIEKDSIGGLILNMKNNRIIGMNKGRLKVDEYNKVLFMEYIIKEFNYYNPKLDLSNKEIGDKELEKKLENINKKELKELNLCVNNISDIKILEKVKFDKLEVLDLGYNKISNNIKILENVNFKELIELYLNDNNISDIKVLEKVKFDKLEVLNLGDNNLSNNIKILENVNFNVLKDLFLNNNNISDINVLEKVNFKELIVLFLNDNKISDIQVLAKVKFDKLEILNLGYNKISNIEILENANFKELKKLYLNNNNISDIKVLENVKLDKLEELNLGYNKISNIKILENVNFKELKKLYLNNNKISEIKVLEKVKFDKLEKLDLSWNGIDEYNSSIDNLKSKFDIYL